MKRESRIEKRENKKNRTGVGMKNFAAGLAVGVLILAVCWWGWEGRAHARKYYRMGYMDAVRMVEESQAWRAEWALPDTLVNETTYDEKGNSINVTFWVWKSNR